MPDIGIDRTVAQSINAHTERIPLIPFGKLCSPNPNLLWTCPATSPTAQAVKGLPAPFSASWIVRLDAVSGRTEQPDEANGIRILLRHDKQGDFCSRNDAVNRPIFENVDMFLTFVAFVSSWHRVTDVNVYRPSGHLCCLLGLTKDISRDMIASHVLAWFSIVLISCGLRKQQKASTSVSGAEVNRTIVFIAGFTLSPSLLIELLLSGG